MLKFYHMQLCITLTHEAIHPLGKYEIKKTICYFKKLAKLTNQ